MCGAMPDALPQCFLLSILWVLLWRCVLHIYQGIIEHRQLIPKTHMNSPTVEPLNNIQSRPSAFPRFPYLIPFFLFFSFFFFTRAMNCNVAGLSCQRTSELWPWMHLRFYSSTPQRNLSITIAGKPNNARRLEQALSGLPTTQISMRRWEKMPQPESLGNQRAYESASQSVRAPGTLTSWTAQRAKQGIECISLARCEAYYSKVALCQSTMDCVVLTSTRVLQGWVNRDILLVTTCKMWIEGRSCNCSPTVLQSYS